MNPCTEPGVSGSPLDRLDTNDVVAQRPSRTPGVFFMSEVLICKDYMRGLKWIDTTYTLRNDSDENLVCALLQGQILPAPPMPLELH